MATVEVDGVTRSSRQAHARADREGLNNAYADVRDHVSRRQTPSSQTSLRGARWCLSSITTFRRAKSQRRFSSRFGTAAVP
jgi:hypothetical protein